MHFDHRRAWKVPQELPRPRRLPEGWPERLVIFVIVATGYLNAAFALDKF